MRKMKETALPNDSAFKTQILTHKINPIQIYGCCVTLSTPLNYTLAFSPYF